MRALKQKNLSLGVEYVHGEVTEFLFQKHYGYQDASTDRLDGAVVGAGCAVFSLYTKEGLSNT